MKTPESGSKGTGKSKRGSLTNILLTGALGNVGSSTLNNLVTRGDLVTAFEMDSPRTRRKAAAILRALRKRRESRPVPEPRFVFGDIRDAKALESAMNQCAEGGSGRVDGICHLAAVIPPATDRKPGIAESVNAGGMRALIEACKSRDLEQGTGLPKIVFASSIAVYGDRLQSHWIACTDEMSADDEYSRSKVACEKLLVESGIPWVVLRLTYIVSPGWIKPDPLLFSMPLATRLEICHTEDAGRAFAEVLHRPEIVDRVLDIGGGESCRTVYRSYLDRMFRLFGLGGAGFLPESAFATGNFHCGWYSDSDEAERILGFRAKSLEDYYSEVAWRTRLSRMVTPIAAPVLAAFLRRYLLTRQSCIEAGR